MHTTSRADIELPVDAAYAKLIAFDKWGEWNTTFQKIEVKGEVCDGAAIIMHEGHTLDNLN